MATSLGTLALKFTADTSGVDRGVNRVQKSLGGMGQSLAGFGMGATGGPMFAAILAAQAVTKAFELASRGTRFMINELGEAATRVDRLAKSADKLTIPIDQMKRLGHASTLAGVDMAKTEKAIGRMLVNVGTGGKPVAERFKEMAGQIAATRDAGDRATLAMRTFGREGVELISVFGDLAGNIDRADRLMRRFDLDISRADAAGVEAMNDAWTDMKFVMDGTFDKLITHAAPAVTVALGDVLDTAEVLGSEFSRMGATWSNFGDLAMGVSALLSVEMDKLTAGVKLYRAQWMFLRGEFTEAGKLGSKAAAEMRDALTGKSFADAIARQEKLITELKTRGPRFGGIGGDVGTGGTSADTNPALVKGSMEAVRAIAGHGANPLAAVAENTRRQLEAIIPMADDIADIARREGTGLLPASF